MNLFIKSVELFEMPRFLKFQKLSEVLYKMVTVNCVSDFQTHQNPTDVIAEGRKRAIEIASQKSE